MTREPIFPRLTYYDTKLLLRLPKEEEAKLIAIIEPHKDDDDAPDEATDAANDLIALRMCLRDLSAVAIEQWGKSVTNFKGGPLWSE